MLSKIWMVMYQLFCNCPEFFLKHPSKIKQDSPWWIACNQASWWSELVWNSRTSCKSTCVECFGTRRVAVFILAVRYCHGGRRCIAEKEAADGGTISSGSECSCLQVIDRYGEHATRCSGGYWTMHCGCRRVANTCCEGRCCKESSWCYSVKLRRVGLHGECKV